MSNGIDDIKIGDIKSLAWRLLLQHGPWALLTIFLIATILGWLPSPQSKQIELLEGLILENRKNIIAAGRQQEVDAAYQNVLLRAMCRNMVPLQQQGQCEPTYYGYDENKRSK